MSENLFRFSIIRPPIAPDARYPPIELSQDSDFQVALARAAANNPLDPRKALDDVAASFIQSPEFAQPAASDQNNIRLEVAYSALDDIDKTTLDHDKTFIELNSKLGVSIDGFLQEPWLAPLVRRIKDTIVALRQLGIEETVGHLATLTRRLRTIETIKKVDMDPSFPFDASDLQLWRDRPVLAPTLVDLKSILSNAEARAEQDRIRKARYEATQGLINQRWNDHLRLASAIKAIKSIPIRNRVIAPPQPWTPPAPPPHLTREGLVNRHLQFVNTFGDLAIKQYERGLALLEPSRINVARAKAGTASAAADDGSSNNSEARINFEKFSDTSIKAVAGITPLVDMSRLMIQNLREIAPDVEIGSFKPNKVTSFTMKQEGLAVLPQDVQALLKEQGLDLSEQPIDSVVSTLENQLTGTSAALDELYKPYNTTLAKITRVGGLTIRSQRKNRMVDWAGALARGSTKAPSITAESVANIFDHLRPRGKLTVLGVADLLVVEQQLIGYEGGDVGYVENVLKGETKSREQTVSSKTEVELFEESETTTTRETENTTTERFEMSIETNNVIKDKESTKAGITISASYGPFVSMSANASKASDRSKEEASKVANDYTKEITSKASDRLQQRVLRRQTTKTTIENIVKESHILKNDAGSQHIAGVYQFYSKVYEAQTWNYGKRTILDFMLPEPGAFLFDKLSSPEAKGGDTTDFVEEFSMEISEILPTNYASIGATYGVTGLDPPPVSMQRMGASFAAGKKEEPMSKADKFTIPAGYKCTSISAAATGVPVAAPYVWTAGDTTYKYTGPSTGYIAIIAVSSAPCFMQHTKLTTVSRAHSRGCGIQRNMGSRAIRRISAWRI